MTSILEKLESDFVNMESTMRSEESKDIDYDDVLPVVEKMQHPLVSDYELFIKYLLYVVYDNTVYVFHLLTCL